MSRFFALCMVLTISASLGWNQSAAAQRTGDDGRNQNESTDIGWLGGNFFADCQDSILLDAFPMLRTLIDMLTQLIDLLNEAEQLISGGGTIDPGDLDPSDLDPGDLDPGDLDPGDLDPSDLDPGDLDPNDIEIPGGGDNPSITNPVTTPGGYGQGPVPSVP